MMLPVVLGIEIPQIVSNYASLDYGSIIPACEITKIGGIRNGLCKDFQTLCPEVDIFSFSYVLCLSSMEYL